MDPYPKNTKEFEAFFKNDEDCLRYIFSLRWPDGYECPACHSRRKSWLKSNGKIKCADCGKSFSVTSGTVFQDSHTPLLIWFRVMWHLCLQKNGISALSLQRSLGLGTYQTSWLCLHKLRKAMVRPGRERLSGTVEVDETYIGGTREGKRGRGADGKVLVLVAVEDKHCRNAKAGKSAKAIGRIRLARLPDASGESIAKAILENVEPGSTLVTDGWQAYNSLESFGYGHVVHPSAATRRKREALANPFGEDVAKDYDSPLPECHLVISLMKRWILGTLQGSLGKDHVQDYLNEFTFRFNRRSSRNRGMLFWRLAQLSVQHGPDTLAEIISSHI